MRESSDNNSEERQWLGKSPVFVKNTFGDQATKNGGKISDKRRRDCMNYYIEFIIMRQLDKKEMIAVMYGSKILIRYQHIAYSPKNNNALYKNLPYIQKVL